MMNVKKPRKPLALQPETIRRLSAVELREAGGGMMPRSIPCSIPCTDICSSSM
jgi:hypothetical protein